MSPDKFVPYRLLSGGAQSPRLHRRLDVYMSTWLLLHSLVSLLDMNVSVYFSTGCVKRNGKQTGIILRAVPSHTFKLLSPLVPGARSSWINNLYMLVSFLSVGQDYSTPEGDTVPCFRRCWTSRISEFLPGAEGLLALVESRPPQPGGRLGGFDTVTLSSAIRSDLVLPIRGSELVCKPISLLLSLSFCQMLCEVIVEGRNRRMIKWKARGYCQDVIFLRLKVS